MIGVFDSGVGGLAAFSVLRAAAPEADLIYFADEANLPYGEKSEGELLDLSRAAVSRLARAGAEVILSACGTVSSTALPILARECSVPLYGILDPLAKACARASLARGGGAILVLGTRATVKSGALAAKIRAFAPHAPLLMCPCPDFVPLGEAMVSRVDPPSLAEIRARVRATLAPFLWQDPCTIALGCTHFSYLAEPIGELFPRAAVCDGATLAAEALLASLPQRALCGRGRTLLTTSGPTPLPWRG